MQQAPLILTHKIQVHLNTRSPAGRQQYYQLLYRWQRICMQAANLIGSHLFVQERLQDFFYLAEDVQYKLANRREAPEGLFNTSRMNTVYALLSQKFKGQIPMHILSSLKMTVTQAHRQEQEALYRGDRALKNHKKDMPIPFQATDMRRLQKCQQGGEYTFNLFQLPLRTYLGRDSGNKRACMEALLANPALLKTSHLQIQNGKLYFLASMVQPVPPLTAGTPVIAEAVLTAAKPLVLIINHHRFEIGSLEDFYYKRLAIQAARRRKQQALQHNRPGHGHKRRAQVLAAWAQKEHHFVSTTLHRYSARLINTCKKYGVTTLLLRNETQQGTGTVPGLLPPWLQLAQRNQSNYSLTEKIKYKALMAGIELIIE